MNVTLKTTKDLINKVKKEVDNFNNKTPKEPEWKYFSEIIKDENTTPEIKNFIRNLKNPPEEGNPLVMATYYNDMVKEMNKVGIDIENVVLTIADGEVIASMLVTPTNNMTNEEYYLQVIWNKGQLISFQKENERNLNKANKAHEEYLKDIDPEICKKLNEIHLVKTQHFNQIDELLKDAISTIESEELKYKQYKKSKLKF